ncbi:MAG TPA: DUF58 domain-containing protein [Planctomycetota bacterium]|nr:DUF58 domain-containing protein [Planctomycetota bacterium]HRR78647.1 DUF58 domain-containing protein [Planctomycetota bacterium]HRT96285.1 DUF58 domain-containing protein [Planctomycetota bacterium]
MRDTQSPRAPAVSAPPPRSLSSPPLLDPDFLRKLDLLEVLFKRNVVGRREGDRPGHQRGGRTEFADHREYTPGDDLRYLDWNLYGRTDRLFVKEFTKQEAVLACVLLDASASMGLGQPRKLDHAKRLAAALAYLAGVGGNEALLGAFQGSSVAWSPRFAGRPDLQGLAAFLEPIQPAGPTDLLTALRALRERVHERSLVVLISDLLEEGGGRRGLRLLGSQRFDLSVLHVLSPQELHPPAIGPVRLRDSEAGTAEDLAVDADALRLYADRLNAFCEGWRAFCQRHDIRFIETSSATPFEECVLGYLRRGGLVR